MCPATSSWATIPTMPSPSSEGWASPEPCSPTWTRRPRPRHSTTCTQPSPIIRPIGAWPSGPRPGSCPPAADSSAETELLGELLDHLEQRHDVGRPVVVARNFPKGAEHLAGTQRRRGAPANHGAVGRRLHLVARAAGHLEYFADGDRE